MSNPHPTGQGGSHAHVGADAIEAAARAIAGTRWPDVEWSYLVQHCDPKRFRAEGEAALTAAAPHMVPDLTPLLEALRPLREYIDGLDGFYSDDEQPDDVLDVLDYVDGGPDSPPLRLSDLRAIVHALPGQTGTTNDKNVRLSSDPARIVPCPHDCGWSGPLDNFHEHRSQCEVRARLPKRDPILDALSGGVPKRCTCPNLHSADTSHSMSCELWPRPKPRALPGQVGKS